jgi:type I restriction enzyme M protein
MGELIDRVRRELTDKEIDRITKTYHAWRGEKDSSEYSDVAGFCRSVTLIEIAKQGHVLTPGRYVGTEEIEDNDVAFEEKMQSLTVKLAEQMEHGRELDILIRKKLAGVGYEF